MNCTTHHHACDCREAEFERKLSIARAALPDPFKLDALADWIDLKFPRDEAPEVQSDLRDWAYKGRQALEELGVEG